MVKIMFERLTVKQEQRITGGNNSANNNPSSANDTKIIDFENDPPPDPIVTSNAQCIVQINEPQG